MPLAQMDPRLILGSFRFWSRASRWNYSMPMQASVGACLSPESIKQSTISIDPDRVPKVLFRIENNRSFRCSSDLALTVMKLLTDFTPLLQTMVFILSTRLKRTRCGKPGAKTQSTAHIGSATFERAACIGIRSYNGVHLKAVVIRISASVTCSYR